MPDLLCAGEVSGAMELAGRMASLAAAIEQLSRWREGAGTDQFTVGLTMGTFDLLHLGHMAYLERARSECDALVVAVDSDERARRRKGPGRPILSADERMEMLRHLRHVDAVMIKPDSGLRWDVIRTLSPEVLIVSIATYGPSELTALQRLCRRVVVLEPHPYASTSQPERLAGWMLDRTPSAQLTRGDR